MLKREKQERGVVELVDMESLVPEDHLLRKVDALYSLQRSGPGLQLGEA